MKIKLTPKERSEIRKEAKEWIRESKKFPKSFTDYSPTH